MFYWRTEARLTPSVKFFPLCFKMVESFENLDNILHVNWAKDKVQKSLAKALNRFKMREEER